MHYLHSRAFIFDLISLIPLDILQFRFGTHPLLRFPRFFKVSFESSGGCELTLTSNRSWTFEKLQKSFAVKTSFLRLGRAFELSYFFEVRSSFRTFFFFEVRSRGVPLTSYNPQLQWITWLRFAFSPVRRFIELLNIITLLRVEPFGPISGEWWISYTSCWYLHTGSDAFTFCCRRPKVFR